MKLERVDLNADLPLETLIERCECADYNLPEVYNVDAAQKDRHQLIRMVKELSADVLEARQKIARLEKEMDRLSRAAQYYKTLAAVGA